jgi:hypothetical protein
MSEYFRASDGLPSQALLSIDVTVVAIADFRGARCGYASETALGFFLEASTRLAVDDNSFI